MTGRTLTGLYFVADVGFTVGNRDGTINGAHAFRIESVGINTPLIFESITANDVFEPGETWVFLVTDFVALAPPTPFDSLGIPPGSVGPPSTASIVILADHFKVYDVDDHVPMLTPVLLEDQFVPSEYLAMVMELDLFANPVDKRLDGEGEGIPDYWQHQKWYRLGGIPPAPHRRVGFQNQFGTQVWRVQDPEYLVVPSSKEGSPGPGICTSGTVGLPCAMHSDCGPPGIGICGGLRHYLCYEVTWAPHKSPFDPELCDQFSETIQEPLVGGNGFADTPAVGDDIQVITVGMPVSPGDVIVRAGPNGVIDSTPLVDDVLVEECEDVTTGDPRYWCNPVQKTVDGDVYPIEPDPEDPELAHLACYDINPKVDHNLVVTTRDQLDEDPVRIRTNELLCVPSEKDCWAGPGDNPPHGSLCETAGGVPSMGPWGFATLVGLLMLTTVAWVAYRRRPLAPGSAS